MVHLKKINSVLVVELVRREVDDTDKNKNVYWISKHECNNCHNNTDFSLNDDYYFHNPQNNMLYHLLPVKYMNMGTDFSRETYYIN